MNKLMITALMAGTMVAGAFAAQAPADSKTPAPETKVKKHHKAKKTAKPATAAPAATPAK